MEAVSVLFDMYGHWGNGPGVFGWLFPFVVLAALVGFAAWALVRTTGRGQPVAGPSPSPSGVDPALAALRLRYARGEISREEYLAAAADLGAHE